LFINKAGGSGSFESPKYDVDMTLRDVFVADEGIGTVAVKLGVSGDLLTLQDFNAASRRLSVSGSGQIALNEQRDARLRFDVLNTSLDPYVASTCRNCRRSPRPWSPDR
jgi:hypothetical protein